MSIAGYSVDAEAQSKLAVLAELLIALSVPSVVLVAEVSTLAAVVSVVVGALAADSLAQSICLAIDPATTEGVLAADHVTVTAFFAQIQCTAC